MSTILKTFKSGVHPKDMKEMTKDLAITTMPMSEDYYILLHSHIGAPATPIVKEGDEVAQGQLIAKNEAKLGANVYSSVSGKVVGIEKLKTVSGSFESFIHIKAEGDRKVLLPKLKEINKESILNRIDEAGIIGLGGAGFPTAFKAKAPNPIDFLIINGAECEPYLNCDNRLMIENAKEIKIGIDYLKEAIGVKHVIVGIEENKPESIKAMRDAGLEVFELKKKYPQGGEKMLIYACTKRLVPAGGLPSDVGVIVSNIATCYAIYDAIDNCEPLYKRVLTVSGKGVDKPNNLWVLNGTPRKEIYEYCGLNENAIALISGGPMMGRALEALEGYTSKTESGLLALTKEEVSVFNPTPCISCGTCAKVCPMNLMPMYIDFYIKSGKTDEAAKYGAMNCMECGSCAFSCPAKRPLVQSIRMAKQKIKEGKK